MSTSVSPQHDGKHQVVRPDGIKRVPATPTEVAAAKLRIVLDKKLGRDTPDWVIRLAAAQQKSA